MSESQGSAQSGRRVRKNCDACFAPITVRLSDHKRGWGRFCDKACAAAHKVGMRPRDVNAIHAKKSVWADACLQRREAAGVQSWPAEPCVRKQVGRVAIKPKYHSPAECWKCGADVNGPGLCLECDSEEQALACMEAGWDGHKGMY